MLFLSLRKSKPKKRGRERNGEREGEREKASANPKKKRFLERTLAANAAFEFDQVKKQIDY